MKRILTAINNPNLNKRLNEEKNLEIIGKDLLYREAILDVLEQEKNIDIIIINNNLLGEIKNEYLIKKIREINFNIKIIFILEKENKKVENILRENNVNDIYYNSEISIQFLIQVIKKNYINSEEEMKKEIEELRKIVFEKNINNNDDKKNNNLLQKYKKENFKISKIKIFKLINKKLINRKLKNNDNTTNNNIINKNIIVDEKNDKKLNNNLISKIEEDSNNKIISISGPPNVGKTTFLINMSKVIINKKILLIDFDINKQNIYNFLGIKKYSKYISKNYLKKENPNISDLINKNKSDLYNLEKIINNFKIFVNKNIDLISGINLISNFLNTCLQEELNNFIYSFLQLLKKQYDLIFIDIGYSNSLKLNRCLFKNSDINLLLIEGNLIGIVKLKSYIEKYRINNFKLIINKNDSYCIDKKILNNIFNYEVIGNINYRRIYNKFLNKNYKSVNVQFNKEFKFICKKLNI